MASTACAPPASKSIAALVGARTHTVPIGQAPGPQGTGFRPRATGLKASLASFRPQTGGFTFGLRVWRNVSVRIVDVFPEFCLIESAISAGKSLPAQPGARGRAGDGQFAAS